MKKMRVSLICRKQEDGGQKTEAKKEKRRKKKEKNRLTDKQINR